VLVFIKDPVNIRIPRCPFQRSYNGGARRLVFPNYNSSVLQLPPEQRDRLWRRVAERIEAYALTVADGRVAPGLEPEAIRAVIASFTFESPAEPEALVDFVASALSRWQVHTPHPRYYGLFNPAPTTMGIAADMLVAAFNPQIAAWSHSPFAAEVEQHLVRALAGQFGYDKAGCDGTFASGGMEANHTAVLAALTAVFPEFPQSGLRALPAQPAMYASAESHHSFLKAARMCGLGMSAVRLIPVDERLRMRTDLLAAAIAEDRARGLAPFLIAATAGTTNAGAIDQLGECAGVAARERLWFHTDAAWGGAAILVPELRPLLAGIERSDSITFDAHKWLSVPMGAGVFMTRHSDILERTFRVMTAYMPKEAAGLDVIDPHLHSMQWSRRFIGLKVFLSLAAAGWDGYAAAIRHQTAMGSLLRGTLASDGWEIVNDTPLPVVCFAERGANAERQKAIVMSIVTSGEAWISTTLVAGGRTVIRACVTNYLTQPSHIEALAASLRSARRRISA
jgi:glutamate/tyrosine decarboxylase-like PLP-dependent enzyme